MKQKSIEDKLTDLQLSPSPRFHRRMEHAAWTTAGITRRRTYIASSFIVLFLGAILTLTPQGRAWAQEMLHFFTRAGSDTLPAPTTEPMRWVDQTPGVAAPTVTPVTPVLPAFYADCGDFSAPRCSIAQIRSKVDFTVKELGIIPEGLYFTGATGGPDDVWIFYKSQDNSWGLSLNEEPWTGSTEQTSWEVGVSAVVETVQIGDITGEYVKGSFTMKDGDATVVWDPDLPIQNLHWMDNGVYFEMQIFDPSAQLDKKAFIALAESLTTDSVAAALTPMPMTPTPDAEDDTIYDEYWKLTAAEAGEQAGFVVLEPARLPEIFSLKGAHYDQEHRVVSLSYPDTVMWAQGSQEGFSLSEMLIPADGVCDLCGLVVGDLALADSTYRYTVVGANATIEKVKIGDVAGEYVEGAWYDGDNTGMKWHNDPVMKVLRWQVDGMAFELAYFGNSITKADLIAIAESIK
jgi:hypothetical protein